MHPLAYHGLFNQLRFYSYCINGHCINGCCINGYFINGCYLNGYWINGDGVNREGITSDYTDSRCTICQSPNQHPVDNHRLWSAR